MRTHRALVTTARAVMLTAVSLLPLQTHGADRSLDFVAEHLPEVAMDNRFASLPLWMRSNAASGDAWRPSVQGGYSQTRADTLALAGRMLSIAAARSFGDGWQFSAFGFIDEFRLSSGVERRPLDVTFARSVPLSLPAQAEISGLSGSARHTGLGVALRHDAYEQWWGPYQWTVGMLWQRFSLSDYAFDYRVLDGPSAGERGRIDYSASYSHLAPFVGLAWPRNYGAWTSTPHVLFAQPLPRRGVVGQITGSSFVARGDTASSGQGRHFGDTSVSFGWDIGYRPWGLTVDIGSVISQALLERVIHKGVSQNWIVSLRWDY